MKYFYYIHTKSRTYVCETTHTLDIEVSSIHATLSKRFIIGSRYIMWSEGKFDTLTKKWYYCTTITELTLVYLATGEPDACKLLMHPVNESSTEKLTFFLPLKACQTETYTINTNPHMGWVRPQAHHKTEIIDGWGITKSLTREAIQHQRSIDLPKDTNAEHMYGQRHRDPLQGRRGSNHNSIWLSDQGSHFLIKCKHQNSWTFLRNKNENGREGNTPKKLLRSKLRL